ncbi:unnamed protein product [Prunus armeniaca]
MLKQWPPNAKTCCCIRDSKRDEVGVWIWVEKKTERKRKNWVLRAKLWVLQVVIVLLLREKRRT